MIGAKNFEEQYVLADLIAGRLEHAGFVTSQKSDLGSGIAFRAGQLAISTSMSIIPARFGPISCTAADMPGRRPMLDQLAAWLRQSRGITLAGPLGFENAYVFAMRADRAKALGIHSLADLAGHPGLIAGGDFEIFSRPEWRSVVRAYGLSFSGTRQYQPDFLYRAVVSGDVDLISAFSSDGRIARYGLTILADPKDALPPYDAMLLVGPAAAHDPRLLAALRPLAGSITLAAMQQANLMVDRDKVPPAQAARWLSQHLTH